MMTRRRMMTAVMMMMMTLVHVRFSKLPKATVWSS